MDAKYKIVKLVFEFGQEATRVEVWCSLPSDGMLGIQGCHKKSFPPSMSAVDLIHGPIARQEYLEWR